MYFSDENMLRSTKLLKGVRIGCSSGFWGDTNTSATQLIDHGNIDYLVGDYLSEITMSLLAKMQLKKADSGYTPDFIKHIQPRLKQIKENNIKIVSNAGGMNPVSCAKVLQKLAPEIKIAAVLGDNLKENNDQYSKCVSANAYTGAKGIVDALKSDAQIIITGRCVDSALVLGPLIYEHGWGFDEYDKLSSGSLAGHIIECGAQSTGGIFTDWREVCDEYHKIGFPIVDVEADGSFVVQKPADTATTTFGGKVSIGTVSEQIVYEIGNPQEYFLPDVVCDWSNVKLSETSEINRIFVNNASGMAPPKELKASVTNQDGFSLKSVSVIMGGDAVQKSVVTGKAIFKRVEGLIEKAGMGPFRKKIVYPIGGDFARNGDFTYGNVSECALWLSAEHEDRKALEILATEVAPAGCGMAPGFTSLIGGRARPTPIFKLDSKHLVDRNLLKQRVVFSEDNFEKENKVDDSKTEFYDGKSKKVELKTYPDSPKGTFKLEDIAWLRSGDKGNHCNIGIVAREEKYFELLDSKMTPEFMTEKFGHFFEEDREKKVEKFYLPGINGFNFMLYDSLGGGGVASIRPDPQGKAYGQLLAEVEIVNE